MKTIRWGIIGCGNVCEIKSGPAFYKCTNSALQAVMRRDADKAADFARRHGVPKYYTKAEDLINDPEVDAVYVATPPSSHAAMTILALEAGKPVYVEKPMGMNFPECEEMIRAAERNHQKLFTAYYRRSLPYFLKIKELIEAGSIGTVQTVRTAFFRRPGTHDLSKDTHTWRVDQSIAGGGYFYDVAPHTIDILMFLLGNITEAKGITGNTAGLYNTEDTVSAAFLFESGVIGSGIWCYVATAWEEKDVIVIAGTKGSIRFSTFDFSDIELITENGKLCFQAEKPQHIQQPHIQSIVDELCGTGYCPSDGISGARTNWVIDRIIE